MDKPQEYLELRKEIGKRLLEISKLLSSMSKICEEVPIQILEGYEIEENPVIDWDPIKENQASDTWSNILKRMSYLLHEVTTAGLKESNKEPYSYTDDKQFTKHIDGCMNELVNLLPEYYWDTFVVESEDD